MLFIPHGLGWIRVLCIKQTGEATECVFTEKVCYFGIFVYFVILALSRQDHLMNYEMHHTLVVVLISQ